MRDENAFNAFLSKQLKKLLPSTYTLKMAEKYHIGVADFQLYRGGCSVVFESKFLPKPPGGKATKALSHPFSGPQLTFLRCMARAGVPAYGVIGLGLTRSIKVVPLKHIPPEGNWPIEAWLTFNAAHEIFSFDEVEDMVFHMFNPEVPRG